ncbi:hypothetical protein [Flavobacterium poyangense]|uniref:hypothetical protein n=1 Tax=Flavobacterium poyangense TaxID=2204302 RepID=UPI0014215F4A|nr:hypothetical protein [Flavobacterium sp. JXAS1]
MIKNLLLIFLSALVGCKKVVQPQKINTFYQKTVTVDDRKVITPEEAKTYHVASKNQYEYRTGTPSHYEYNYDVKGINSKGDSVFGNINVEGKYGAGILLFDTIADIEIKTVWIAHGKLKAIDKQGNKYLLVVD